MTTSLSSVVKVTQHVELRVEHTDEPIVQSEKVVFRPEKLDIQYRLVPGGWELDYLRIGGSRLLKSGRPGAKHVGEMWFFLNRNHDGPRPLSQVWKVETLPAWALKAAEDHKPKEI